MSELEQLKRQNKLLIEAHNHLLKALPHINHEGVTVGDDDKKSVVNQAVEGAAFLLKYAFDLCGLETHIVSTVEINNEFYGLSFTKKTN
jgi:seryl-tRNA synthetase